MKIAIFNHPFSDFYTSPKRLNPHILDYLASLLKPIKTITFDVVKDIKKRIDLPDEIKYLNEWLLQDMSEYSFFKDYYKFGDEKSFDHSLFFDFNPDAIFITSFAFCYFDGFREMVTYLKEISPNTLIFCGGAGPSAYPDFYLRHSKIDYVAPGSIELNLKKIVKLIREKKQKILHSSGIITHNVTSSYNFKPMFVRKDSIVYVQLTRGCPKSCSYCSIHLSHGKRYLKSKLQYIRNQVKSLDRSKRFHIDIEDDNISYDIEYFKKVLAVFRKYLKDYSISFENGIDWTTLDNNILAILEREKVTQWNISLAAVSNDILKKTGRSYKIDNFDNLIERLKLLSNFIIVYFICGLPDDNEENIFATLCYLTEKEVLIGVSVFYPVPNTKITKHIDSNLFSKPILTKGSSFYQWGAVSTKKLVTFFMLTRFVNCLNKVSLIELSSIKEKFEDNFKEDFTFKLDNNDRKILTLVGIYFSLREKKIFSVQKKTKVVYKLKEYNLDKVLVEKFFNHISTLERFKPFFVLLK